MFKVDSKLTFLLLTLVAVCGWYGFFVNKKVESNVVATDKF